MSNDIQLAFNSGLQTQPTPFGTGLGMPIGAPPAEPTAFDKVHRLLRGRYLLAIVLGLLFACAGAVGGFMAVKPSYASTGTIEIDPRQLDSRNPNFDKALTMYGQFVQSQMVKLQAERTIKFAMQDKRWKAVRPGPVTDAGIADFTNNLTITVPPKVNTFIMVTYTDSEKDSKDVAPVAVACLISAYQELYSSDDAKSIEKRVQYWNTQKDGWEQDMRAKRAMIDNLAKLGEDDPVMVRALGEEVVRLETQLREAKETLASAEQDLKAALGTNYQKPSVEDWGRIDPTMERHVTMRNELVLRIDSLDAQLGKSHPAVVRSQQDLAARQRAMDELADKLNTQFVIRWKPDGSGGALIPRNLDGLRESVKRLDDIVTREAKKVQDFRVAGQQITTAKQDIDTARTKIQESTEELRELNYLKENIERIKILSPGNLAVPDKDRRPVLAAAGFMGGFALPVGLLMLIGMFDSRYRYSDQASGTEMSGLTLLGILPNLPDRLSDPEQAAIAAHCVHQIRTMLQINGGVEERRVFAVTSASPGDGKTSLTLALGLSYAACGTRTLLIDCDLIGGGLTSRMNVSAAEGVLEAIANRNLLQYVRSTDIADVAILPVGSAGNLHASTLSPAALRRLVEEAEKHFETILIDTGPILGSIEASLVCAAADAVILTVARGQQRPMVEKSLSHLAAIGAKLAGVVFNRAQANDFERSISGVSMRSVGMHGPRSADQSTATRLGPVARAVASDGNQLDDSDQPEVEITES